MDGTAEHPIREYRARAGISLDALAKRVGTSKATLSRVEAGKQPVSQKLLPKIAEETGIPRRDLRPDLVELLGEGA